MTVSAPGSVTRRGSACRRALVDPRRAADRDGRRDVVDVHARARWRGRAYVPSSSDQVDRDVVVVRARPRTCASSRRRWCRCRSSRRPSGRRSCVTVSSPGSVTAPSVGCSSSPRSTLAAPLIAIVGSTLFTTRVVELVAEPPSPSVHDVDGDVVGAVVAEHACVVVRGLRPTSNVPSSPQSNRTSGSFTPAGSVTPSPSGCRGLALVDRRLGSTGRDRRRRRSGPSTAERVRPVEEVPSSSTRSTVIA